MCVWGGGWGGGGRSSYFFRSKVKLSEIPGGPTYVIGVGGGHQTFFQGGGVQLLSNRAYDLYWTPVPTLDPRNYQGF